MPKRHFNEGAIVVISLIRHEDLMVAEQPAASEVHADEDVECKAGCQRACWTPPVITICSRSRDAVSPDVIRCKQLHAL